MLLHSLILAVAAAASGGACSRSNESFATFPAPPLAPGGANAAPAASSHDASWAAFDSAPAARTPGAARGSGWRRSSIGPNVAFAFDDDPSGGEAGGLGDGSAFAFDADGFESDGTFDAGDDDAGRGGFGDAPGGGGGGGGGSGGDGVWGSDALTRWRAISPSTAAMPAIRMSRRKRHRPRRPHHSHPWRLRPRLLRPRPRLLRPRPRLLRRARARACCARATERVLTITIPTLARGLGLTVKVIDGHLRVGDSSGRRGRGGGHRAGRPPPGRQRRRVGSSADVRRQLDVASQNLMTISRRVADGAAEAIQPAAAAAAAVAAATTTTPALATPSAAATPALHPFRGNAHRTRRAVLASRRVRTSRLAARRPHPRHSAATVATGASVGAPAAAPVPAPEATRRLAARTRAQL